MVFRENYGVPVLPTLSCCWSVRIPGICILSSELPCLLIRSTSAEFTVQTKDVLWCRPDGRSSLLLLVGGWMDRGKRWSSCRCSKWWVQTNGSCPLGNFHPKREAQLPKSLVINWNTRPNGLFDQLVNVSAYNNLHSCCCCWIGQVVEPCFTRPFQSVKLISHSPF